MKPLVEEEPWVFLNRLLDRGEAQHLALELGVDVSTVRSWAQKPPTSRDDRATGKPSGIHRMFEAIDAMKRLGWYDKIRELSQYFSAYCKEAIDEGLGLSEQISGGGYQLDEVVTADILEDKARELARVLRRRDHEEATIQSEHLESLVGEVLMLLRRGNRQADFQFESRERVA